MADEAETRRRNGSRSKLVLEYFMQYPGQMLTASQVSEGTGLDASQVRGAVRKMIEDGTTGAWEVNLRGNAWTYHPAGVGEESSDAECWEVVRHLKSGDVLLEDEDGNTWRATRID